MNGSSVSHSNGYNGLEDHHLEHRVQINGKSHHINGNGSIGSPSHVTTSDSVQDKFEAVVEAAAFLTSQTKHRPQIAIICGTGLSGIADKISDVIAIPYSQIPGFTIPGVVGHIGRLVFGKIGGKCVVCMVGRSHFYEGHSTWQITFPVRVFHQLGVRLLMVTNAGGSLNPDYVPGDIMIIKDHINLPGLAGFNVLRGLNDERFGHRFPPMNDAYDWKLRALMKSTAADLGLSGIHEGVYVCQSGPTFETVAEIRMLRIIGGDSIGMSTAPEVAVARHGVRPMRCVGLSLITNYGVSSYPDDPVENSSEHANGSNGTNGTSSKMEHPDHNTILQTGERRAADLQLLVAAFLNKVDLTTSDVD